MSLYSKIIDLQKLGAAWEKVKKNKPACGVDNVTYEWFEANKKQELKQLCMELREHTYQALPVRKIVVYKGSKAREIALYTMRDKVVQQSVASELNKIYDSQFSNQTYAYRNNKSALNAVNELEIQMMSGKYHDAVKLDITHFFDMIQWQILETILRKDIQEEDVLKLIEENVKATALNESGELVEKTLGIYQGSGISPILSNIYMMEFDQWLSEQDVYFVRYSDDMLVLGENREILMNLIREITVRLQSLGLILNEDKTVCADIRIGVDFLGHHLSSSGKTIPDKAKQNLQERLETMWLTSVEKSMEEKLKKAMEIIGGWEQYFREPREKISIFEYAALVCGAGKDADKLSEMKKQRMNIENIYPDIMLYLAEFWRNEGELELELLEYEQFYQIWDKTAYKHLSSEDVNSLLSLFRKVVIVEEEDTMTELMQTYTDLQMYEKAAYWMQKKDNMIAGKDSYVKTVIPMHSVEGEVNIIYDKTTVQRMMRILIGREDIYGLEIFNTNGKRQIDLQMMPLSEKNLLEHLSGNQSIGTYVQRSNATAHFLVIDIDISKKVVLQYEQHSPEFEAYMEKVFLKSQEFLKLFHDFGMTGYVESSGYRGYHVWMFFSEWISVRYINMFCDILEERINCTEEGISIEFFPNKTRIKPGKFGQVIKIPYGLHLKTGKRSFFLDENSEKVTELNVFLDNLSKISLGTLKRVLASNSGWQENVEIKVVDMNLEAFEGSHENAIEILRKCNLMRYLCQKSQKTGYLTHFERLSILYVFGHLGEEGKQFVHQVMSFTLNYQYNVTEKFIRKLPGKPISCIKLREQYKKLTAEFGCNCSFKRTKNCYPSPVMHAISLSNDLQEDITLPTSRSISKEKQKSVIDEINIHKKAQELAKKILEMKKQKRALDSGIAKLEKSLEQLYDDANVDCLEIDMGLLVRRKNADGYEWLIEI